MFIKNNKEKRKSADDAEKSKRSRGRPRGPTAQGEATRKRLYRAAITLLTKKGYDDTTLRQIARRSHVSVGLLYRYFPSKDAIVLALYDELSADFAARVTGMAPGSWRDRVLFCLRTSIEVLRPYRTTLTALVPILVGSRDKNLFAKGTAFSRERVERAFCAAVCSATDAPEGGEALGRVLYVVHLLVILLWLLDQSEGQHATQGVIMLIESLLPTASFALALSPVRAFIQTADTLARLALFGEITGAE